MKWGSWTGRVPAFRSRLEGSWALARPGGDGWAATLDILEHAARRGMGEMLAVKYEVVRRERGGEDVS